MVRVAIVMLNPGAVTVSTYFPEWDRAYLCCYCNFAVRLTDSDGMCDSYRNVVHKQCMAKVWNRIKQDDACITADIRRRVPEDYASQLDAARAMRRGSE